MIKEPHNSWREMRSSVSDSVSVVTLDGKLWFYIHKSIHTSNDFLFVKFGTDYHPLPKNWVCA